MSKCFLLIFSIIFIRCKCQVTNERFPDDFLFGTASSAYQIEGAWNAPSKAESIWDYFVHQTPSPISNNDTGDVACDSYNKYDIDIQILKELGVNFYRFSLSWSRLLPRGDTSLINNEALNYYHRILDRLERNKIIPMVTIYHNEHPQSLERSIRGWLSEEMAVLYSKYADFVFQNFAHRVKYFVTLQEPHSFCRTGYTLGIYAPGYRFGEASEYLCLHNMLKANALAYEIYNKKYRGSYGGKLGMSTYCRHYYARDKNFKHLEDWAFDFECGWQAQPVFLNGDYPQIVKDKIAQRSTAQGLSSSKLPTFNVTWREKIKGSADFFGLDYYTSATVEPVVNTALVDLQNDTGLIYSFDPNWPSTETFWQYVIPDGLGKVLREIRDKYNNPLVIITENGLADGSGVNDNNRTAFLYSHLKEVQSAMNDGCDIRAYTVWTFIDNFEWNFGYTNHFGIVDVNFNDSRRTRTLKKSALWYKTLLQTRRIPPVDIPIYPLNYL